jgi:hypothetical protein
MLFSIPSPTHTLMRTSIFLLTSNIQMEVLTTSLVVNFFFHKLIHLRDFLPPSSFVTTSMAIMDANTCKIFP